MFFQSKRMYYNNLLVLMVSGRQRPKLTLLLLFGPTGDPPLSNSNKINFVWTLPFVLYWVVMLHMCAINNKAGRSALESCNSCAWMLQHLRLKAAIFVFNYDILQLLLSLFTIYCNIFSILNNNKKVFCQLNGSIVQNVDSRINQNQQMVTVSHHVVNEMGQPYRMIPG